MIYYGCIGDTGHYPFNESGQQLYKAERDEFKKRFPNADTGYCPDQSKGQVQGVAKFTLTDDGWTVLAFWDRSLDTRPGSHSSFFIKGYFTFDEMVQLAQMRFPQVWGRYKFKVRKETKDEQSTEP